MTTTTYQVRRYVDQRTNSEALTVTASGAHGDEENDLNTGGEPCRTIPELRAFVNELCREGFYSPEARDALLTEVDAL